VLCLLGAQEVYRLLDKTLKDHFSKVNSYLCFFKFIIQPLVFILQDLLVQQIGQLHLAHVLGDILQDLVLQASYLGFLHHLELFGRLHLQFLKV